VDEPDLDASLRIAEICGRFTTHDFQRWGRLWWWRMGELAKKPGEHRAALELLIAGRPSDLARESERAALPPAPEEFAFVAGRDFRLVRFGGLGLVVAEIPAELDLPMTMRLVRERYVVPLSLARRMGSEAFALADDGATRRAYDLGGMVRISRRSSPGWTRCPRTITWRGCACTGSRRSRGASMSWWPRSE
jgi:hypothetical protein